MPTLEERQSEMRQLPVTGVPSLEERQANMGAQSLEQRQQALRDSDVSLGEEIKRVVVGGARDAFQGFLDVTESLGAELDKIIPLGSVNFDDGVNFESGPGTGITLPDLPEPDTEAGKIARGVVSFLVGLVPALRVAKMLGVAKKVEKGVKALGASQRVSRVAGILTSGELAAEATAQTVFDPMEGGLSNLLRDHAGLNDPVTAFLSVKEGDSEGEARSRLALEGLGLGVLLAPFILALDAVRASRGARREAKAFSKAEADDTARNVDRIDGAPEAAAPKDPDLAANINLNRINTEEEAKQAIRNVAEEFSGSIDEARRGVITHEETKGLADDLHMTPEELTKRRKGQAFNAEEALAARRLLVKSSEDIVALGNKAVGGTDEDLIAFQQALTRHVAIQEQVSGMTAEAGRALAQFNIVAETDAGRVAAIKELINSMGGRENIEDMAKMAASFNDPAALAKFARESRGVKVSDVLLEVWINSLLSGPRTHVVNMTSNAITALWSVPEHLLAAGFGAARKGGDKVFFGEVIPRLFGMAQGAKDGMRLALRTLITETPSDTFTKIEARQFRAVPGPLGQLVRIPGRFLMAEDEFFKSLGYRMELNSLAYRSGVSKGLKGRELAEHIRSVVNDPPESIRLAAIDTARYQTFTRPLGKFGQAVQRFARDHPVVKVVLPFIRTPTNLAAYAIERTPLAFASKRLRDNLKAGGAKGDLARAKLSIGTAFSAAIATMAAEGLITGSGPSDPATRAMLRETGWQPYSIKVGDEWVSYQRADPLAMVIGLTADFVAIAGEIGEEDAGKVAASVVMAFSNNVTNKTWLRGLSDIVEAIGDPDRYGERLIQSLAGTLIPTGVAQFAQSEDPVLRDARTIVDKWCSRIPGCSKTLPPRRNVWGEAIVLGGGLGPDIVSPYYVSKIRDDPTSNEMVRLGLVITKPERKISGVELTPEQYDVYQQLAGRGLKRTLDLVIAGRIPDDIDPAGLSGRLKTIVEEGTNWNTTPDFVKKQLIGLIKRSTRTAARNQMIIMFPELAVQGAQQKIKEIVQ
jgi:hypothetical protein